MCLITNLMCLDSHEYSIPGSWILMSMEYLVPGYSKSPSMDFCHEILMSFILKLKSITREQP